MTACPRCNGTGNINCVFIWSRKEILQMNAVDFFRLKIPKGPIFLRIRRMLIRRSSGHPTVSRICEMTPKELLSCRNFGMCCFYTLANALLEEGLQLASTKIPSPHRYSGPNRVTRAYATVYAPWKLKNPSRHLREYRTHFPEGTTEKEILEYRGLAKKQPSQT